MQKSESKNIESVQFLRGIAAFGVMLSHSSGLMLPKTNILQPISIFGSAGIYVFFIISGFIIPYSMHQNNYSPRHFKNLMLRRIVRIEPTYIICIAMIIGLYYFTYFFSMHTFAGIVPLDWGNVLGHIGYINAFTHRPWLSPVFWTLAIEFEYYILIGLVFSLVTSSNKKVLLTSNILLLATFYLTPYLNGDSFNIYNAYIFYFISFFLMGIALFLKRVDKITNAEFIVLIILDSAVCAQNFGFSVLMVCIFSLLSIVFIKRVPSKILLWLGTISYSLYLTHGIVVGRFMDLTGRLTKGNYLGLRLLLCLVASVLFAYVYYLLFEKPFIKLSKRIKL